MSEYPLAVACSRASASTAACSRNRSRLGRRCLARSGGCVNSDVAVGSGSTWLDRMLDDKLVTGARYDMEGRRRPSVPVAKHSLDALLLTLSVTELITSVMASRVSRRDFLRA